MPMSSSVPSASPGEASNASPHPVEFNWGRSLAGFLGSTFLACTLLVLMHGT